MKIAYFTNTYPRATDTFIRREVLGLRKAGFDVYTYSVRRTDVDHDVDKEVTDEKASTQYLLPINYFLLIRSFFSLLFFSFSNFCKAFKVAFQTSRPGLKGAVFQFVYFLEAVILVAYLKKDKIDHIHNHLGDNSGNVTLFASLLSGVPFSISIHGPHIFFEGGSWALKEKSHYAKFIACIGDFCRSQMMLHADIKDWSKLKIIRCGIDLSKFDYRKPSEKIESLVYVGRLDSEKGLPILFSSLSLLKSKGLDFKLSILGDGKDRGFLESLAVSEGLANDVEFLGFVNQKTIAEYLNKSDVFVLPSFAEGIPVALMEAMAIGIPVVTTYVGGIAELVIDGETGFIVYPANVSALACAIEKYIDDPEMAKVISLAARRKVEKEFNTIEQIDKLSQLFSES